MATRQKNSLREVAARAGVSFSTVSRVLNDVDVKISEETRERVRSAAVQMGYHPNRAARSLVTGRTQTIALCVATIHSAHSARVISTALSQIFPHGYDMVVNEIRISDGYVDTSKMLSLPADGIMLSEMPHGMMRGLEGSLLLGRPFVNVGAYVVENADVVQVDFTERAAEAVVHLHSMGCRRIAYLVPDWLPWFREHSDARLRGYEAGMKEVGQTPELILPSGASRSSVGGSIQAHIEQHGVPDGLFCYNDEMAVGALRKLQDLGLRVPEDVALVGCDGIEETAYHNPPISTIVTPMAEMCARAWEYLAQRISTPDRPLQRLVVQPHLEVRASSRR